MYPSFSPSTIAPITPVLEVLPSSSSISPREDDSSLSFQFSSFQFSEFPSFQPSTDSGETGFIDFIAEHEAWKKRRKLRRRNNRRIRRRKRQKRRAAEIATMAMQTSEYTAPSTPPLQERREGDWHTIYRTPQTPPRTPSPIWALTEPGLTESWTTKTALFF